MNGTAKENLGKIPVVRSTATVGTFTAGNEVRRLAAGAVVEFVGQPIKDLNPASTITWLPLADGNYVNFEDATHKGAGAYFKILTQPTIPPVTPPPPATVDTLTIELAPGSVLTRLKNGVTTKMSPLAGITAAVTRSDCHQRMPVK